VAGDRALGRDALVGRFVGIVGSARPISTIVANGDSLSFSIPISGKDGNGDLTVHGRLHGTGLTGMMTFPDGRSFSWTAVRAPRLELYIENRCGGVDQTAACK